MVLETDGLPTETGYIVFTLWALLTMVLSVVVIARFRAGEGLSSMRGKMRIAVIMCNIVLLGFICWALIDQYPHPEEDGFITYVILMMATPILSITVLLRKKAGGKGSSLKIQPMSSRRI